MRVADDCHLEASRAALVRLFVMAVFLAWNTSGCGDTVVWVGIEQLHRSSSTGHSQRRSESFTSWTKEVSAATFVNMSSLKEGLGRIIVAGAREHETAFLGSMYRCLVLHPRGSTRRVPALVASILLYSGITYGCPPALNRHDEVVMVQPGQYS